MSGKKARAKRQIQKAGSLPANIPAGVVALANTPHGRQLVAITRQNIAAEILAPMEVIGALMDVITALNSRLYSLIGNVYATPGNLWADTDRGPVFIANHTDAGALADLYTQALILAESVGAPRDLLPDAPPVIAGIANLCAGRDSGDSLRAAVAAHMPAGSMADFLAARPKPGRRRREVIDYVCELAHTYQLAGRTWEETYEALATATEGDPAAADWLNRDRGDPVERLKKAYYGRYPRSTVGK